MRNGRVHLLFAGVLVAVLLGAWGVFERMQPEGGERECLQHGGQWRPIHVTGGRNGDGSEINGYTRAELQREMSDMGMCLIPGVGRYIYAEGGLPMPSDPKAVIETEFRR